jgi:hypothetical protein
MNACGSLEFPVVNQSYPNFLIFLLLTEPLIYLISAI